MPRRRCMPRFATFTLHYRHQCTVPDAQTLRTADCAPGIPTGRGTHAADGAPAGGGFCKRQPPALQKAAYYTTKGRLLECKRRPFAKAFAKNRIIVGKHLVYNGLPLRHHSDAACLYFSKSHAFCSSIVMQLLSSSMASSAFRSGETSRWESM